MKPKAVHLAGPGSERTQCGRLVKPWRDDIHYDRLCKRCAPSLPAGRIVVFSPGQRPYLYDARSDNEATTTGNPHGPVLFTLKFTQATVIPLEEAW